MKSVLLQNAIKLDKKRKIKNVWGTLVRIAALGVVFCTTYILILPAITSQSAPVCGYEEHIHSEECWMLPAAELTGCDLPENVFIVHQHAGLCFNEAGDLICPLPEIEAHTHEDGCYAQREVLNCPVTHVHDEECVLSESILSCGLEETEPHEHDESCSELQETMICGDETHEHDETCFAEESVLICELEETPGHFHDETCWTVTEIPCPEISVDEHTHDETCYLSGEQGLNCTLPVLHFHADECLDEEGALICGLPEVMEHVHTEDCLVMPEDTEPVLVCELEEHTHDVGCYPLEEEPVFGTEYLCGQSVHTHNEEYCYDEDGNIDCTIPEHIHEASCIVEDFDLTADVEDASQWEEELTGLEYTGVWAEDLVTVAKSQLDYTESQQNCFLIDDLLYGYTRYGEWFGDQYDEWDDMFVSFCLYYAEIPEETVPYESDTAVWIEKLIEAGLYADAEDYTPVKGDLIFWDSNEDGLADKSGIVCDPDRNGGIEVIVGDTEENCVDTLVLYAGEDGIVGYAVLPLNPISQEDWNEAEAVSAMMAELPDADILTENLRELNETGDRAGYEALRQEAVSRMEEAENAYNALDDVQKERVEGLERLEALQNLFGIENWEQFAVLEEDGAVLSSLKVDGAEILRAPIVNEDEGEQEAEEIPEDAVRNADTIVYTFTAEAVSYYTDVRYGEAAVKVEFVLPLTEEKAVFVTEEMAWLEDSVLTTETRTINETETVCQVLTGYKRLTADETNSIVVPGSFTETAVVQVLDMAHGESVVLILSAAMEHNTWDGTCELHQIEEKLTVAGDVLQVYAPVPEEVQEVFDSEYEAFLARIEELDAQEISPEEKKLPAEELLEEVIDAYYEGLLDISELEMLGDALRDPLGYFAEYATGTAWMLGMPEFEYEPEIQMTVLNEAVMMRNSAAFSQSESAIATVDEEEPTSDLTSGQQIKKKGGEAVSKEGAVMVSKTIEGTDTENVFDITLQIVTKDEVNEVYEDPDMAVVVVMDISNTMITGYFNEITRYQAALAASADFLHEFADNNNGISKVGFVGFNTHSHEVFPLQSCSTSDDANRLVQKMQEETMSIMYPNWKNQFGTFSNALTNIKKVVDSYGASHDRFTNMEAGLALAYDMLEETDNRHKYIIFLTDGFPTTYLKANSSTEGYDPYTSTGTNGNDGVFYDAVQKEHCDYGTSYSDTAAIKARTLAVNLKEDEDVNIFSIGVDIGGQTLWYYHKDSYEDRGSHSVFERRENASYYYTNGYEIGTLHSAFGKDRSSTTGDDGQAAKAESAVDKTAMAQDFKDWLKGTVTYDDDGNLTATTGIGSGYYYDSTSTDDLKTAYDDIFAQIKRINANSAHLDWVATDPMSDMGVHEVEAMEFIGFWDMDENDEWVLKEDDLTGESRDGNLYDNTADFHEDTQTIHWDIKKSGYISLAAGNTTTYLCELKYRVRLKNEEEFFFVEREPYDTNDTTTLTYRIIEVEGEQTVISEQKTVDFPIPQVEGYLSELTFTKTDPTGAPLAGAEFTLTHAAGCKVCRGDGKSSVSIAEPEGWTAVSDHTGKVSFDRIPSGHTYILTETKTPEGYITTKNTYQVTVAYDKLTVTITDENGDTETWPKENEDNPSGLTIVNDMYYALPETGGQGTHYATFGGLLILAGSLVYLCMIGQKRQKGRQ